MRKITEHFMDGHVSFVYEDICREKLWQLSAGGNWPFYIQKVGRWWNNKDAKIDLVALDEEDGNIIFGECKYWKGPVEINVLEKLKEKAAQVEWGGQKRQEYFVLFSVNGFTSELEALARREGNISLFS